MQTAIGGGGGNIGKNLNHGGGDGGDDGGDDDDYFDDFDDGEEGDEGGLFRRRIILQEVGENMRRKIFLLSRLSNLEFYICSISSVIPFSAF